MNVFLRSFKTSLLRRKRLIRVYRKQRKSRVRLPVHRPSDNYPSLAMTVQLLADAHRPHLCRGYGRRCSRYRLGPGVLGYGRFGVTKKC